MFKGPTPPTPAAIGRVVLHLEDVPERTTATGDILPAHQLIRYQLEVLDVDGQAIDYPAARGDARPYLSAAVTAQLETLMHNLRAKAESEVLP